MANYDMFSLKNMANRPQVRPITPAPDYIPPKSTVLPQANGVALSAADRLRQRGFPADTTDWGAMTTPVQQPLTQANGTKAIPTEQNAQSFFKREQISPINQPSYEPRPQGFREAPQSVIDAGRQDEWNSKMMQQINQNQMGERFKNSVRADRAQWNSLPSASKAMLATQSAMGDRSATELLYNLNTPLSDETLGMKSAMKTGLPYADELRYLSPEAADKYNRSTQVLPEMQLEQEKMRLQNEGISGQNAEQLMQTEMGRKILGEQERRMQAETHQIPLDSQSERGFREAQTGQLQTQTDIMKSENQRVQDMHDLAREYQEKVNPLMLDQVEQQVKSGEITLEEARSLLERTKVETQLYQQNEPIRQQQGIRQGESQTKIAEGSVLPTIQSMEQSARQERIKTDMALLEQRRAEFQNRLDQSKQMNLFEDTIKYERALMQTEQQMKELQNEASQIANQTRIGMSGAAIEGVDLDNASKRVAIQKELQAIAANPFLMAQQTRSQLEDKAFQAYQAGLNDLGNYFSKQAAGVKVNPQTGAPEMSGIDEGAFQMEGGSAESLARDKVMTDVALDKYGISLDNLSQRLTKLSQDKFNMNDESVTDVNSIVSAIKQAIADSPQQAKAIKAQIAGLDAYKSLLKRADKAGSFFWRPGIYAAGKVTGGSENNKAFISSVEQLSNLLAN